MKTLNPMIQNALDNGQDTTGLCTVRELAAELLRLQKVCGERVIEMFFTDDIGRKINVEVAVTYVDGVKQAESLAGKE